MIISHRHRLYQERWNHLKKSRYNGAYYYSKEIVENIIPKVKTDRHWITVNLPGTGCDHAIVFIHNNLHPHNYDWLTRYKDLILVCGVRDTCDKVKHIGRAIYLPLSINTAEVEQYKRDPQDMSGAAFAGRASKRVMKGATLPKGIATIEGLPREQFLEAMAGFETIYAVGRTAIEARCLGCDIGIYDERYPDPSVWQVIDNSKAAEILQAELDKIDSKPDMNWTKAELIEYATANNIKVNTRDTKSQILELINA